MSSKQYDGFISYSRKDGVEFVNHLRQNLAADPDGKHLKLWKDREQMEGDKDWWKQIMEACSQCEHLILIITPEALKSGVCQKEWRYAREQGICVLPVKGVADNRIEYQLLPAGMSDVHIYEIDQEWRKFVNDLNKTCTKNRVVFMAPSLPRDYVERKEIFDFVKKQLLYKVGKNVSLNSALKGAGGFGKTTMAAAICHDQEIKEHYHNGILWATLGEDGNLQREITRIYRALTGEDNRVFIDDEEAARSLSHKLEQGKYLLVLDDVWNYQEVRKLIEKVANIEATALLITTRIDTVVQLSGSTECAVNEMSDEQSFKFFTTGWDIQPEHKSFILGIIALLRGWLLLLKLIKSAAEMALRKGEPLLQVLSDIKEIYVTEGLTAFDVRNNKSRNDAVDRCIGASFRFLTSEEKEKCLMLGIFPTDVGIPVDVIYSLWQTNPLLGKRVLQFLDDYSLLNLDLRKKVVTFHDVFLHYYKEKLGEKKDKVHLKLVNGWNDIYRLPNIYAWNYFIWHLKESGEIKTATKLLQSFDWIEAKLFATNISDLLKDYEHLYPEGSTEIIYNTLKISAHILAEDINQLPAQLIGRTGYFQNDSVIQLSEKAKMWRKKAWLKPLNSPLPPPGNHLLKLLKEHIDGIAFLLVNKDKIISWSINGNICIWEIDSGKCLQRKRENYEGKISSLFVHEGKIITGSKHGYLCIWEMHAVKCLQTLRRDIRGITSLLIHEGKIVSGSTIGHICTWEIESGECVQILEEHTDEITSLLAHENKVVSASADSTIRIWKIDSGDCLQTLRGHTGGITSLLIHEGKIISGSADSTIRIWEIESGGCLQILRGHTGGITSLLIYEGKIISGSADSTIRIWKIKSGMCLQTLWGHTDGISSLLIHEGKIISGSADNTIRIWKLESGILLQTLRGHVGEISSLLIHDDKIISSGSWDSTIRIWELESGLCSLTLPRHTNWNHALLVHEGKVITKTVNTFTGIIDIWEIESGRCLKTLKTLVGHTGEVGYPLSLLGNTDEVSSLLVYEGKIISGSKHGCIYTWEIESGLCLQRLSEYYTSAITFLLVHEGKIIGGSAGGFLCIWKMDSSGRLQALRTLKEHTDAITCLIAYEGKIFSGSADSTIRVWEIESGMCLQTFRGHIGEITTLLIHEGKVISSGLRDSTIRIWELASGQSSRLLMGYTAGITCLLAYKGKILSGSADGTISICEIESGQCLQIFKGHSGEITSLLTYEGKIISGSADSTISIWEIESGQCLHTIEGHTGEIRSLLVKDNNLISTDSAGLLIVYDAKTFTQISKYYSDVEYASPIEFENSRIIIADKAHKLHILELT